MSRFRDGFSAFLNEFGKSKKMVLSTSENNRVTSRMMSIIQMDGRFYFQTDKSFGKYSQIKNNPFVALCMDNIQIEGICKEIGRPIENEAFSSAYKECFSGSYKMYSSLEDERLFVIEPTYLERWSYKDGVPFLEEFDIEKEDYKLERYTKI